MSDSSTDGSWRYECPACGGKFPEPVQGSHKIGAKACPFCDLKFGTYTTDNQPTEGSSSGRERTDHPDVEQEIKLTLEREFGVDPRTASRTAINWYVDGLLDPSWEPDENSEVRSLHTDS